MNTTEHINTKKSNSIQTIINTKNQKVMKTKKYSVMMRAFMAAVAMFLISSVAMAQIDPTPGTTTQVPISEERSGGTSTFTATGTHAAGDEFTWEVWGDTPPVDITDGAVSIIDGGAGTSASPYVVNWTPDLDAIVVEWADDASGITNTNGNVSVQKRLPIASGGCLSLVQSWDIDLWANPDAAIDPTETDLTVCSGDAIGGSITINLEGAPDDGGGTGGFEVNYDVAVTGGGDLTVSGPNGTVGVGKIETELTNGSLEITLPDALVNTGTTAHTYTITLNTVRDDFDPAAVAVSAPQVFTITVNPVPETGTITSTGTLTRR